MCKIQWIKMHGETVKQLFIFVLLMTANEDGRYSGRNMSLLRCRLDYVDVASYVD